MISWKEPAALATAVGGGGATLGALITRFLLGPRDPVGCHLWVLRGRPGSPFMSSALSEGSACLNYAGFMADSLDPNFLMFVGALPFAVFAIGTYVYGRNRR